MRGVVVYRVIGAATVFSVSFYMGMTASYLCGVRVEQLDAFCGLIGHIGAQIEGYLMPLDEIYRRYSDKRLERIGFLAALNESGGLAAAEKCRSRLLLTNAEMSELKSFFSELGGSSADKEIKHCRYYGSRFAALTAAAREEKTKKARLYRAFGMLVGIMLIVMLL